jgi:hypothetical protein
MASLVRLQQQPGQQQQQKLLRQLLSVRHQLQPKELADSAAALGAWGTPPSRWCQSFCDTSQPQLQDFPVSQACRLLWALVQAGHQPSPSWLEAFCAATLPQMAKLSAQDMATCSRAFALLHFLPPAAWMAHLVHESGRQLTSFSPAQLSNLCWGLAQLGAPVAAAWFERAMQVLERSRPAATPSQLAITLSALAALKPAGASAELVEYVLTGCLAHLEPSLDSLPSDCLHHLAFSAASFGFQPQEAWMGRLLAACRAQLPAFSTDHLAVLLGSLQQMGYMPGAVFISEVVALVRQRKRKLQPAQLRAVHTALLHMDRKQAAALAQEMRMEMLAGTGSRVRAAGSSGAGSNGTGSKHSSSSSSSSTRQGRHAKATSGSRSSRHDADVQRTLSSSGAGSNGVPAQQEKQQEQQQQQAVLDAAAPTAAASGSSNGAVVLEASSRSSSNGSRSSRQGQEPGPGSDVQVFVSVATGMGGRYSYGTCSLPQVQLNVMF